LSDQKLALLYEHFRDVRYRRESPDEYFDRISSLPPSESENHAKIQLIRAHVPSLFMQSRGECLDIGCGAGLLLARLKVELGPDWSFHGVEPTPEFAEIAARRTGARVVQSSYRRGLVGAPIDFISCCQVLEHVANPRLFLEDMRCDLAESGVLYLEVPDISDFGRLPASHDRFLSQHLSYFSEGVLRRLLESVQFEVCVAGVSRTFRGRNNLWILAKPDMRSAVVR